LPVIGEELGVIATLAVLLVFAVIFFCGIYISYRARDPFGALMAFGITLVLSLQGLINIAVVTSSIPAKGIPLPFVSYGGSSMLVMAAMVGILVNVARQGHPFRLHTVSPPPKPAGPKKGETVEDFKNVVIG
jgi:cell division protein FtsW